MTKLKTAMATEKSNNKQNQHVLDTLQRRINELLDSQRAEESQREEREQQCVAMKNTIDRLEVSVGILTEPPVLGLGSGLGSGVCVCSCVFV